MRTCLLSLLVLGLAAPPVAAQDAAAPRVTWMGRVLEQGSDRPVEAAAIQIEGARFTALSDSLGRFALPNIAPGTYTVTISRLGYVAHTEELSIAAGEHVIVRLLPQPIMLEQIRATADRFEARRRAVGLASSVSTERDLLYSGAATIGDYVASRHGFRPAWCPNNPVEMCVLVRGRVTPLRLYVDDVRQPGGWGLLDHMQPQEIYRVEVFPSLAMMRLYTPWYAERLAEGRLSLRAACIAC